MTDERSYATTNGFYIGDEVSYAGDFVGEKQSNIKEIIERGILMDWVKLDDGTEIFDIELTRIGNEER